MCFFYPMVRRRLPRSNQATQNESSMLELSRVGLPLHSSTYSTLVRRHHLTIVFLVETEVSANVMESIRVKLGISNCFSIYFIGRSGGLSLLWNDHFDLIIQSYSKYHIDALVNFITIVSKWRLTCVYGDPQVQLRSNIFHSCVNFKCLLIHTAPGYVLVTGTSCWTLQRSNEVFQKI